VQRQPPRDRDHCDDHYDDLAVISTRLGHPTQDVLLIRLRFEYINEQFRQDPELGLLAELQSDYYAQEGIRTPAQCLGIWHSFDAGQDRFLHIPIERTIAPAPGWRMVVAGQTRIRPVGRVYALTPRTTILSRTHRFSNGRDSETFEHVVHVTIFSDGSTYLFAGCGEPTET